MVSSRRTFQFTFLLLGSFLLVACAGHDPLPPVDEGRNGGESPEVERTRFHGDTDKLVWSARTPEASKTLDVKPAGELVDTVARAGTVTRLNGSFNRLVVASPHRIRVWSLGKGDEASLRAGIDDISGTVTSISQPKEGHDGLIAFGTTDGFYLYDYDLGQYLIDSYEKIHAPVKFFAGRFVAGAHNFEDGTAIIYVWSIREEQLYKRVYLDRAVSDFSIVITPLEEKHILSVVLRGGHQKVYRLDRGPVNEPPLLKENRRDYLVNHDQVNMNLSRGGFLIFSNINGFYLFESRQSKQPRLVVENDPSWDRRTRWRYVPGPTRYGSLLVPNRRDLWDVYGLTRNGGLSHGQFFGREATFIKDGERVATVDRKTLYVFDRGKLNGFELLREIVRFKTKTGSDGSGDTTVSSSKRLIREYFPRVFGNPEIDGVRYDSTRDKFLIDVVASNEENAGTFKKTLIVDYPVEDPPVKKALRTQLDESSPRVIFKLSNQGIEWDSAFVEIDGRKVSLLSAGNGS